MAAYPYFVVDLPDDGKRISVTNQPGSWPLTITGPHTPQLRLRTDLSVDEFHSQIERLEEGGFVVSLDIPRDAHSTRQSIS